MNAFRLDNDYTLALGLSGKRLRLVILKKDVENVCRMETIKKLKHFIKSDGDHLFRGRLQLHKTEEVIEILVREN